MRAFFTRFLGWLNLLDSEKNLSITNLAIYLLVGKMMFSPALDWPSVTAMIVTFANYMHKRQTSDAAVASEESEEMSRIKAQYESAVVAQAKAITDIQTKLSSVTQIVDLTKMMAKK